MDWFNKPRKVTVVVDNDSWILPYAEELVKSINAIGDKAVLCRDYDEIEGGYIAFYLGCINLAPKSVLSKNQYNLVVHESNLPQGRGFAPVAWQILEGKNDIIICLIEAAKEADSGHIYLRKQLVLEGHELNNEIRNTQGEITIEICLDFLKLDKTPEGTPQTGEPSCYHRRRPSDSELSINKTIEEQFNLLRIVDNDRYPAFFEKDGYIYKIIIEKM